ncbi:AMP-binding protein [Myxococcota bacterium]|nr:AMP-binding protein [Myxococcota bacterium]
MTHLLHELTVDGLLALQAARIPDAPALHYRGETLTYAQLDARVTWLAAGLQGLGLAPGEPVAMFTQRSQHLVESFLGIARAGGVVVPMDARVEVGKIEALIRDMGVQYAIVDTSYADLVSALPDLFEDPRKVVVVTEEDRPTEFTRWDAVMRARGALLRPPPSNPLDDVYVNLTSGSTGIPKGAPSTHSNIQWNTRACVESLGFRGDDVYLCMFSPAAHPHEHWARPLAVGGAMVMVDSLHPRTIARAIARNRVTWIFGVPSLYELLLAHLQPGEFDFSAVRMLESAGAVVSGELMRRSEEFFQAEFTKGWGCTETTGITIALPPGAGRDYEALGRGIRHYELKVVGDDDAPVPDGEVGELCVRGPAVVRGYRNREEENATRFRDGWYHTGDLVRRDPDGLFFFMGRKEEMIKVGGVKVYLVEIENALRQHPDVADAVVVPAQEKLRGEIPRAVIVPRPGASLSRKDVVNWCRGRIAAYEMPRQIEFWDELIRFPSGKVNKRAIQAQRSRSLALAVNTMLVKERDVEEAFRLARALGDKLDLPVVLDLRSRRSPESDPGEIWRMAWHNADFDLADPAQVERAVGLARRHRVEIAATSAYLGACHEQDVEYGRRLVEGANRLAAAAPDETLLLRVLGGNIKATGRGMVGRWQDIRRQVRQRSVEVLKSWEAHARALHEENGRKVVVAFEIHQGQFGEDLHDLYFLCRGLRDTGWEFIGLVEDPANRFIASGGDELPSVDFGRLVSAWGGRIVAYHLKDVRYVSPWSDFHTEPIQRVGDPVFVWNGHKFQWVPLGEGEVDLEDALMAAHTVSRPPHDFCLVSTEYVAGSADEKEAKGILQAYARLVQDGKVERGTGGAGERG